MLKRVILFLGIVIGLGVLSIFYPYLVGEEEWNAKNKVYEKQNCFVNRVIDGDTLVCDNESIRLLGIDTPERGEQGFEEAKEFLQVVEGKEIEVLRDWDDKGKYYRKLRYIFYEDRLINIEIVENGLARVFMSDDLIYEEKLFRAEEFAKQRCVGVWEESC